MSARRSPIWAAIAIAWTACASPQSADCPSGTEKIDGVCKVACSGPADCAANEVCDLARRVCVLVAGPTDGGVDGGPAEAGMDAGPRDAEPGPDRPPVDVGPQRTVLNLVGGGGVAETGQHRLRLHVGSAPPVGAANPPGYRLTIGPGAQR